jgi:hypothetical protein
LDNLRPRLELAQGFIVTPVDLATMHKRNVWLSTMLAANESNVGGCDVQ